MATSKHSTPDTTSSTESTDDSSGTVTEEQSAPLNADTAEAAPSDNANADPPELGASPDVEGGTGDLAAVPPSATGDYAPSGGATNPDNPGDEYTVPQSDEDKADAGLGDAGTQVVDEGAPADGTFAEQLEQNVPAPEARVDADAPFSPDNPEAKAVIASSDPHVQYRLDLNAAVEQADRDIQNLKDQIEQVQKRKDEAQKTLDTYDAEQAEKKDS